MYVFFCKTFGKDANLIGLSYRGVSFLDFANANIILVVCGITWEETPLCHDFGNAHLLADWSNVLHIEEARFHRNKIMRSLKKSHARATRYRRNLRLFFFFLKRLTFRLRYALGMRQFASLGPIPFRGNASGGNGDYMLVWHDIFSSVYLLPVRACVQVISSCECG